MPRCAAGESGTSPPQRPITLVTTCDSLLPRSYGATERGRKVRLFFPMDQLGWRRLTSCDRRGELKGEMAEREERRGERRKSRTDRSITSEIHRCCSAFQLLCFQNLPALAALLLSSFCCTRKPVTAAAFLIPEPLMRSGRGNCGGVNQFGLRRRSSSSF